MLSNIKNLFKRKKEKDSEEDKILKNNTIDNTELKMTGITETDSCIVYINNIDGLLSITKREEGKELLECNFSCIKILIESTFTQFFLDSLDFFNKINHENIKEFLDILFLFDTESKQEVKVYLLISGSISDYIWFIDNYENNYGDRNDLIVGIILKQMQEIPMHYNHYEFINDKYDLNLEYKKFNNYQINQLSSFKTDLAKITSGTVNEDFLAVLDTTMLRNGYDKELIPESFHRILDLFIKKEIDQKKFNILFYCKNRNEKNILERELLEYSICGIYNIKFSKLFYQCDKFSEELSNILKSIQENNIDFLKEHSFTYKKNVQDEDVNDESNQPLNMLDMVDEIIN